MHPFSLALLALTFPALAQLQDAGQMPIELHAKKNGIELRFTSSLDTQSAADPDNWNVKAWRQIRSQLSHTKRDQLKITSVSIGTDERTVFLEIPELKPAIQISINYSIKSADGANLEGEVVKTIDTLADSTQ